MYHQPSLIWAVRVSIERGLYEHEGTYLYVTRGIGMEGSLPPIRFFALPEVSVIDLVPAQ